MITVLLISAAMSVDAIGLGLSFGSAKIKLGICATLIVSLTGFIIITLAMLTGASLQYLLPPNTGKTISGIILIVMGLWVILQSCKNAEDADNRTVKIIRAPQEGDLDKSGTIDKTEAFFMGLALSLDSIGICIGAGSMRLSLILPFIAMFTQILFILLGIKLGEMLSKNIDTKICTLLSGALIILIGIFNI